MKRLNTEHEVVGTYKVDYCKFLKIAPDRVSLAI
jgi:hypothetical protein